MFVCYDVICVDKFSANRGISSTVRRCIEKETGIEFAAKIIDLSNDSHDGGGDGKTMLEATIEEVKILRLVAGHPFISGFILVLFVVCFLICYVNFLFYSWLLSFSVEMHDVFESSTFIFLVFELCKNGELFDYLTTVVTLSEKKTR